MLKATKVNTENTFEIGIRIPPHSCGGGGEIGMKSLFLDTLYKDGGQGRKIQHYGMELVLP